MIKIDIISGFLGAGKTTLIKKLFEGSLKNQKVALIENEFGEIGIDGGFLKDSGIEIKEINSGCICCSLVGNFSEALNELVNKYNLDRIIIEPSGVGKLSEIVSAVKNSKIDYKLNIICTVVDGAKCKMYIKNFGEFFIDQISEANTIVISRTDMLSEEKIISACELIKTHNPTATIITTPIFELDGKFLLENLEDSIDLTEFLINDLISKGANHHHHHDHECCEHHHDEECTCGHNHDHDHECCEHHDHDHDHECCEHHDHDCCDHDHDHECCEHHDHDCCDHDHDHECCEHHHHDEECTCGHNHDHDHECCKHHHHDADEVFSSWGQESPISYSKTQLESILNELSTGKYGIVLRAKGIVKGEDTKDWYYFDFVSGDFEIRTGSPDVIGKCCVIGSNLKNQEISDLFNKRG